MPVNMKKNYIVFFLLFCCSKSFFAEKVNAEKEILKQIECGTGTENLKFIKEEEITRFPRGPFINEKGDLFFYYNDKPNNTLIYSNDKIKITEVNYFEYEETFPINGQNLGGYIFSPIKTGFYCFKDGIIHSISGISDSGIIADEELPPEALTNYYPVEKGVIVDFVGLYDKGPHQYGIEIAQGKVIKIIEQKDLNEWLNKQKGKYQVKKDEEQFYRVYRNDILWTANYYSDGIKRYIGRIKSGHIIYSSSKGDFLTYSMPEFIIARPDGTVEFKIEIPWSGINDYEKGKNRYSYSFGNWGELYAIIHPRYEGSDSITKGTAELIAVRNHLKYFGILNDDRIRLRKGPGTDTESLGTYPIKTGFRIIEDSGVKQTIDGVTDTWVKVRLLDGTEGYFFGQYVQNLYDGPGTPLPWPNVADWD